MQMWNWSVLFVFWDVSLFFVREWKREVYNIQITYIWWSKFPNSAVSILTIILLILVAWTKAMICWMLPKASFWRILENDSKKIVLIRSNYIERILHRLETLLLHRVIYNLNVQDTSLMKNQLIKMSETKVLHRSLGSY